MVTGMDHALSDTGRRRAGNPSDARILLASMIGTTIEFFDFFAYGTAAVLCFPQLFFPTHDPASALLQSLATFSIAFFARPFGAAIFGHFGDRIGRKATLVAALMTMGLSTAVIGILPTYASIGVAAPLLLALARVGQGIGLGGEWGGATLLAAENAPPHRRGWYAAFPQFGSPTGFVLSTAVFYLLTTTLSDADFLAWGWRVPFLFSILLVGIGLYVRLKLIETPEFQMILDRQATVSVPIATILKRHKRDLALGTVIGSLNFVLFYLIAVFLLSWGGSKLGYPRQDLLVGVMIGACFEILTIPVSGLLADRFGRRRVLLVSTIAIGLLGLILAPLFESGLAGVLAFYIASLCFQGLNYGSIGAALAAPFPAEVRYTGTAMAFNFAGILGGSLVPYIATWLASAYGLAAVGGYLTCAAIAALAALVLMENDDRTR